MFTDSIAARAVLAGFGVALVAGPLGCFVVWRRMAYFGDTLSHAGLMGVALGLMLGLDPALGMAAAALLVGLLLFALQHQHRLPADTLLGILSHTALAAGLIAVGFMDSVRVDLMGYLFGDILAVTPSDLAWIYGGAVLILGALAVVWRPLVAMTVHADMAAVERAGGMKERLVFMILTALTVAIAMKVVGILLVTALLIIPAAAARRFAASPEAMAVGTVVAGALAVTAGIAASFAWDLPSGASIVMAASVLFAASLAVPARG